jgi:hypothetical protein
MSHDCWCTVAFVTTLRVKLSVTVPENVLTVRKSAEYKPHSSALITGVSCGLSTDSMADDAQEDGPVVDPRFTGQILSLTFRFLGSENQNGRNHLEDGDVN